MLKLAAENRAAGRVKANGVDLYYFEILHKHFGWQPREHWRDPAKKIAERSPGGVKFDPDEIGRETYNATMAALSRSVRRLEQRELVAVYSGASSHWSGLSLTENGVAEAARIT